ncbi:tissue factor pathway inhibitor-like [Dermacentor silvarum]|uniref:tissue factor pathway inhibitor-like n=1 Tax=Dermacentor silvarum TaxID=543639 RepID=UPI002100A0FC|nr:tissue factor pathway inhibitor-like [Dermacentor silvarum]
MFFYYLAFILWSSVVAPQEPIARPECAAGQRNDKMAWTCYEHNGNVTCRRRSYFYNNNFDKCEQLDYKGCGGNKNNFHTIEECTDDCRLTLTTWDLKLLKYMENRVNCTTPLPKIKNGTITRYYYHKPTRKCRKAQVLQGDLFFPSIRLCVHKCNATNKNIFRCKLEKKLGTQAKNWTCKKDPKYNDLVCYRPTKKVK